MSLWRRSGAAICAGLDSVFVDEGIQEEPGQNSRHRPLTLASHYQEQIQPGGSGAGVGFRHGRCSRTTDAGDTPYGHVPQRR